ncbi:MAG: SagB family peptide dehydrogenase [Armatimonadota bacterium]|nr:SagB family peptide dehydrogenase [Armatimonadota bacterium]MDR7451301.1 SagB family peptide dehydrogenase [Armatimonadota bacterium]MDR7466796.1 SagB family peptide dehydrogenase [Armatimonadota bacterium]MDR7492731.1 SagB family peptide dehydrogenase [Armatimonadota bacterium]MDR7498507.1 SagB family peptide dehydrogenase [Armatimonadota bacterium]
MALDDRLFVSASAVPLALASAQDDPAELYHEASKLQPSLLWRQMAGVRRMEQSPEMQRRALRAGKRFTHRPVHGLPPPHFGPASFEAVLRRRGSSRAFGEGALSLADFATILYAAYGITRRAGHIARPDGRTVPSGGALYPLDVYAAVQRVEGLPPGVYHYDPAGHRLAALRSDSPREELVRGLVDPSLAEASAVMMLAACFWRSRFKYGLRAYRFVLLEAGHLAQNVLLTAAALDLAVLPIGGYFDRRIDDLLALDGVHESVVYLLALGLHAGAYVR